MKTIELTLFQYSELSESAKEKARDWFTEDGGNVDYIYSDAECTVKAFFKHFPGASGRESWLDINTGSIDDNILELSGHRLATYLWNNFETVLFKRKYLKHGELTDTKKPFHRMRESKEITNRCPNKGKFINSYYSNIQKESSCVLTGVCYDDDLLQPIYDFLNAPDNSVTFEDLLSNCFYSLKESIENEIEYRNSEEAIAEDIEANDYTFLEDGTRFDG